MAKNNQNNDNAIIQQHLSKVQVFKGDLSEERLNQHLSACYAFEEGQTGYLAVDCEMMGLKPSRDRLCLVQMCDENKNISLVQIEPGQEESPNLKKLLEHQEIIKMFHFARADMAFLEYHLAISVNPVFCTKIASKLARTYTESHGLKALAKEIVGVDVNKNQQSNDWGRDELSQEQVEYAVGDVIFLHEFKDRLLEMLDREGKTEIAYKCFLHLNLIVELDLLEYDFVFEHNNPLNKR